MRENDFHPSFELLAKYLQSRLVILIKLKSQ